MNRIHWPKNNTPLFLVCATFCLICAGLGVLNRQVLLFAGLAGFNQPAHRFEHAPRVRLSRVIRALQRVRVLRDPRDHRKHHRPPHSSHYCVLTPWLNPVLDRSGLWRALERVLVPAFGAPRRPDLSTKAG